LKIPTGQSESVNRRRTKGQTTIYKTLQNVCIKETKDWAIWTPLKTDDKLRCSGKVKAVPATLVAPAMFLHGSTFIPDGLITSASHKTIQISIWVISCDCLPAPVIHTNLCDCMAACRMKLTTII
jgi:hypothetical protein